MRPGWVQQQDARAAAGLMPSQSSVHEPHKDRVILSKTAVFRKTTVLFRGIHIFLKTL